MTEGIFHMPMVKKIFFAGLSLILFTFSATGQERNVVFEHLNRKEGLPQVSVNAIAQDELGFLWFGTQGD